MDFKNVIKGVMNLSMYRMMRESGSTASELGYFHDHKELEKQYQSGLTPDQLGKDMIDAATCKTLGGLQ